MLALPRRLFRKLFPRRRDPLLDGEFKQYAHDARNESAYRALIDPNDPFVAARYFEGIRWRNVLAAFTPAPARLLDVGAGDGAIELALSAGGYSAYSVEPLWNDVARRLGVRRVIADAESLPFRCGVFDALVCLETLEHLVRPRAVASELARVTVPNAVMLLTTPPRWRFAFRRDPHFGIRGLLLLPTSLQRRAAPEHFVDRIYGSVKQIERALSPFHVERVLSRTRTPRRWFWDAIVLRKRPGHSHSIVLGGFEEMS
ncbi:MAG: hypothetical protein DMF58_15160 [Acidobacteria bacterium]|nr:MAG: hypothetical protein DMF58_15160 [Acidobacteriota bacterium]